MQIPSLKNMIPLDLINDFLNRKPDSKSELKTDDSENKNMIRNKKVQATYKSIEIDWNSAYDREKENLLAEITTLQAQLNTLINSVEKDVIKPEDIKLNFDEVKNSFSLLNSYSLIKEHLKKEHVENPVIPPENPYKIGAKKIKTYNPRRSRKTTILTQKNDFSTLDVINKPKDTKKQTMSTNNKTITFKKTKKT